MNITIKEKNLFNIPTKIDLTGQNFDFVWVSASFSDQLDRVFVYGKAGDELACWSWNNDSVRLSAVEYALLIAEKIDSGKIALP